MSPEKTATLTGLVFMFVEVVKHTTGINGKVGLVRLLAILAAVLFSFGDALFNNPDAMGAISYFVAWNCAIRAMLIIGSTFGINALRSDGKLSALDSTDPLAPVTAAINAATVANQNVKDALTDAGTATVIASDTAAKDTEPAPDTSEASAGQETALPGGSVEPPIPDWDKPRMVSLLMSRYRMSKDEGSKIVTEDPALARRMETVAIDTTVQRVTIPDLIAPPESYTIPCQESVPEEPENQTPKGDTDP